jgi:hypothetical protein
MSDFHAIAWVFCFVVFALLIFQSYLIVGFGGGGELEGTLGVSLDLNSTRLGIPTDIYRSVSIPNRWYFTFRVDTVATFVVTLNKGYSTAVCTKEV